MTIFRCLVCLILFVNGLAIGNAMTTAHALALILVLAVVFLAGIAFDIGRVMEKNRHG